MMMMMMMMMMVGGERGKVRGEKSEDAVPASAQCHITKHDLRHVLQYAPGGDWRKLLNLEPCEYKPPRMGSFVGLRDDKDEHAVVDTEEKFFALGYSKTGTTSVVSAFGNLGFRGKHYSFALLDKVVEAASSVEELVAGWPGHNSTVAEALRERLETAQVLGDLPAPYLYREFMAAFPKSRYVLTLRSVASWSESITTWVSRPVLFNLMSDRHVQQMMGQRKLFYGSEKYWRYVYERHYIESNLAVLRDVPCCRLLVMNVLDGDGYEKLVPFLDPTKAVPNLAFPHKKPARRPRKRRS